MNQVIKIRSKEIISVSLFLCFFLQFQTPASAGEVNDYDSIIVHPKERVLRSRRIDHLMYRSGISKFQKIKDQIYVVPVSKSDDRKLKIAELKQSGLFRLVEPDYKLSLDWIPQKRNYIEINNLSNNKETFLSSEVTPNDQDFDTQYYLREINATKAWNTTVGDSLLVGILDTGIDVNHPDLAHKVLSGSDLSNEDLTDEIGHGTAIAGIIAANTNNKEGIAGIAWNTKVVSLKVTREDGRARVSTVVSALENAYTKGIKIVQISLGTNEFSQTLKDAIKEAQARGILIISTGGNSGTQELRYPAAFDGVIGVGAVDQTKNIESYSTTGEHIALVAPGSDIYTTSILSSYEAVTGTSFSAPQVAGTAALVWSLVPDLSNDEVREILIESAEDLGEAGKDTVFGYGLLNTQKAVEIAKAKQNETNVIENKWIVDGL